MESENAFKDKLKSLLRKVKEESEKAGLKLNIKKLRSWHLVPSLMASRWGTSGNSDRFYIPVLQNHCGWWLQPWSYKKLAPWKKSYDKPTKRIKKQRYYFPNKSPSSKAMVFPVVMYGWEIWVIKKAEHQRIDAFKLWCWRRLLRLPIIMNYISVFLGWVCMDSCSMYSLVFCSCYLTLGI